MTVLQDLNDVLNDYNKVSDSSTHREAQFLAKRIKEEKLPQDAIDGINILALHVLQAIGNKQPIRAVELTEEMEITKGATSKITARLIRKNLISKEHKPDNKKDVYYQLTDLGTRIFKIHDDLHKQERADLKKLLDKFSEKQIQDTTDVLNEINLYRKG